MKPEVILCFFCWRNANSLSSCLAKRYFLPEESSAELRIGSVQIYRQVFYRWGSLHFCCALTVLRQRKRYPLCWPCLQPRATFPPAPPRWRQLSTLKPNPEAKRVFESPTFCRASLPCVGVCFFTLLASLRTAAAKSCVLRGARRSPPDHKLCQPSTRQRRLSLGVVVAGNFYSTTAHVPW